MAGRRNSMTASCQYNFTQIIDSPTHIHGHILEVVHVRDTFSKAVCAMITAGLSDDLAITFLVNIPIKAPCKFRQVNTRENSQDKCH